MKVSFRSMVADDHPDLVSLWKESPGVVVGQSDTLPALTRFLERNLDLSWVAVADGRIVGAVLCGHDGRRGYLHHLAVDVRYRRRHIGRHLVARCLDGLAAAGIPRCHLFVFLENRGAIDFWRACGWTVREDLRMISRMTEKEQRS